MERLPKINALDALIEREDVAAVLAGKAVADAFIRRDEETGVLVIVKRTETNKIPAFLLQLTILSDQLFDR